MDYLGKHRRICAWMAALLVAAVLLFSGLFIAEYAEHGCTGEEDCTVCAELHTCASVIHLLTEAAGVGAASILVCMIARKCFFFSRIRLYLRPVSLVSLKIRLDH